MKLSCSDIDVVFSAQIVISALSRTMAHPSLDHWNAVCGLLFIVGIEIMI